MQEGGTHNAGANHLQLVPNSGEKASLVLRYLSLKIEFWGEGKRKGGEERSSDIWPCTWRTELETLPMPLYKNLISDLLGSDDFPVHCGKSQSCSNKAKQPGCKLSTVGLHTVYSSHNRGFDAVLSVGKMSCWVLTRH